MSLSGWWVTLLKQPGPEATFLPTQVMISKLEAESVIGWSWHSPHWQKKETFFSKEEKGSPTFHWELDMLGVWLGKRHRQDSLSVTSCFPFTPVLRSQRNASAPSVGTGILKGRKSTQQCRLRSSQGKMWWKLKTKRTQANKLLLLTSLVDAQHVASSNPAPEGLHQANCLMACWLTCPIS